MSIKNYNTHKVIALQIIIFIIIILFPDNFNNVIIQPQKNMSQTIIYTKGYCPFCVKAKKLLDKKGIVYQEIDIEKDEQARQHMLDNSNGRKTVPQIFINGTHVGGCDDLYELEERGQLDNLILVK